MFGINKNGPLGEGSIISDNDTTQPAGKPEPTGVDSLTIIIVIISLLIIIAVVGLVGYKRYQEEKEKTVTFSK